MSYWGKIIGGLAGFAMGGPMGAVFGAAMGHAADSGAMPNMRMPFGGDPLLEPRPCRRPARTQGPVVRHLRRRAGRQARQMRRAGEAGGDRRVPPPVPHSRRSRHDVGRLFDQARDRPEGYEEYARQLAQNFTDNRGMLEDVLAALFQIAQVDGPVNRAEHDYLSNVHRAFGLDQMAWDRARGASRARP